MEPPRLVEGRDYYLDVNGLYVFTAAYLLARGHCCRSGCRHCPYGFSLGKAPAQGANGDPGPPPDGSPAST